VQTIRRRKTIGRTIKSLRPSNRTRSNPLPNVVDDQSASPMPASEPPSWLTGEDDVFSNELPVSGQPETVCVDTSGSSYRRQSHLRLSATLPRQLTADGDSDVVDEQRRLSSWRQTICDTSKTKPRRQLMMFSAVDVDRLSLFRGLATRKSTSRRSLVDSSRMTSKLKDDAPWQRKVLAWSKSGGGEVDDGWRLRADCRSSCSWRQSVKSLLKGIVRTRSSVDLWATAKAPVRGRSSVGDRTATTKVPINFRRANSLPRSLKAMKRHSVSNAAGAPTKSKSKSVDDQLDSSDQLCRSSLVSEVTPAGERLGRSVSMSRCQYQQVHCGAASRVVRPQSMEVHIVTLDELGRPLSCGTASERRVHVSIPEQPWTKPFADVRLRQRTARVVDSIKYQSSSGRLLDFLL